MIHEFHSYCEQVERNQIKISLSGTWSTILYDESIVEVDNELSGLFRSETLLRVCFFVQFIPFVNMF